MCVNLFLINQLSLSTSRYSLTTKPLLLLAQRLSSRLAIGVQEWLLANTNSTMACTFAKAFVIIRRTVEDAAIIPER